MGSCPASLPLGPFFVELVFIGMQEGHALEKEDSNSQHSGAGVLSTPLSGPRDRLLALSRPDRCSEITLWSQGSDAEFKPIFITGL